MKLLSFPSFETKSLKTLFYDCETVNCFPSSNQPLDTKYSYCKSSEDYQGMGISVIGVYTTWTQRYHVFLADNLTDFEYLIHQAERIVGFNSIAFDDRLCQANGIKIKTDYDLLCEVRKAIGVPPYYVQGVTPKGYSLNAIAKTTLNLEKTGSGADAPQQWQDGQKGKVIDYCLNDVMILKQLYDRRHELIDPKNGQIIKLAD